MPEAPEVRHSQPPPIRLCCFQRHWGVQCPDGKVMCQLCFDRFEIDELALDPKDNKRIDICQPCWNHDHTQLREAQRKATPMPKGWYYQEAEPYNNILGGWVHEDCPNGSPLAPRIASETVQEDLLVVTCPDCNSSFERHRT